MGIMNHKSPSSRYPAVGDNYKKREAKYGSGEWPGYIYDPFIDKYRPDPKVQGEYYEETGLVDKQKKPSLLEQLYPTVAGVGAYEIGKAAGPDIYGAGKGLLGLGETGTATTTAAETGATTTAATEGAAAGTTAATEGAAIEAGAAGTEAGAGTTAAGEGAGMLAADGAVGSVALPVLGAAAVALNAKNASDAYNEGDQKSTKNSARDPYKSYYARILGQQGQVTAALAGLAGNLFGSKKDEGQRKRDAIRGLLKEGGFVDESYNVELADGTKFDLGRDGSERLYEFDEATKADPFIQEQLKLVNPLAKILTGGDADLGGQFAGMFTNAIRASGDPLENAKAMYAKAGITNWDQARAALQELKTAGKLTDQEVAVYDQGLANIFGGVPMALPKPAAVVAGPAPVTATPEQAMGALGSIGGATPGATTPITQGPALGGLMSLGRAQEPVVAVTPVARPTFQQPTIVPPSPFTGGLMSLQRPQQEQEMVVVPVARGGYR